MEGTLSQTDRGDDDLRHIQERTSVVRAARVKAWSVKK